MCGLCGVFLTETHWSDAGVSTPGHGGRTPRHERLHRVALANRILRHYGMKVGDWQGSSYLLSGPTGQSSVLPSIAAVWPAAEQMRKRPLDPLDLRLLDALDGSLPPGGGGAG
jgi:hypothetical protein